MAKRMSAEDRKKFAALLTELQQRGMSLPDMGVYKDRVFTDKDWRVDGSTGFFSNFQGKKYNPTETQLDFINSRSKITGFISGRGGGKTTAGCQKSLNKIKDGQHGVVINPEFENFKFSTWDEFRKWIPWHMVVERDKYRAAPEWMPNQPFVLHFINGASVTCKGLKDPDSARGANVNWLWYDEGGNDKDGLGWQIASSCVRIGRDPQMWVTSTPKGTDHWMYDLFVEEKIDAIAFEEWEKINPGIPFISCFYGSITDNKENLDPSFYAQQLATYSEGWLREQELFGKFVSAGGSLGNRDWFNGKIIPLSEMPELTKYNQHRYKVCRYWDLAASEKKIGGSKQENPDATVGTKMFVDYSRLIIADQLSIRKTWDGLIKTIIQTAYIDGRDVPIYIEQEPGSGGKNQVAAIAGLPELAGFTVRAHDPKKLGDKIMRSQPWYAKAERGLVYLVQGEWNSPFLHQFANFPNVRHDDLVDSVSGCFAVLIPPSAYKGNIEFLHI